MIIQLKNYQSDVENCTQTSISLWYSNRVNEFGNLHNKLSNLEEKESKMLSLIKTN
jgi:hypothetical protein